MSIQSIQSQDINISDVFQSFYAVPDYQREYVWQSEQVEQLLSDIYAELNGAQPDKAPEYFIGSIVVCPGKDGGFDLIDGQQRMTTLFITLCAIRDRFAALGLKPPGAIDPQIAATSSNSLGQDVFRYRLDLQYEDSGDVLIKIAEKKKDEVDAKQTRSIGNILNAHNSVSVFLTQQFGDGRRRCCKSATREFSLEGQAFAGPGRLFVPIRFCRQCGQDYYHAVRSRDGSSYRAHPVGMDTIEEGAQAGYRRANHNELALGGQDLC
jgi:hypothetical protein